VFEADSDPDDASDDGKRLVARASRVFNAAQVDGYASTGEPERLGPIERIAAADLLVSATGARIEHGGRADLLPAFNRSYPVFRRGAAVRSRLLAGARAVSGPFGRHNPFIFNDLYKVSLIMTDRPSLGFRWR
jgi:hypothetical protein